MVILSRMKQLDEGSDDNANQTILSEHMFAHPAIVFNPANEHLSKIKGTYEKQGSSVSKALKEHKPGWRVRDQVITFQEQIKDKSLKGEVIKTHHDLPTVGHLGHYKTLELVSWNYFWPGMS